MALDWKGVLVLGALGALVVYASKKQIVAAAEAVGTAVNPVSDKNLAYKAANAVTQVVTGQSGTSFGSWIYDLTHSTDPTK